ncbi:MAG TPA: protein kinase [Polyangiaceae bacterium]|jgi:serine/threonine-protein kinase|nr:protein kinase [Polyangiaceae bacterium]
MSNPGIVAAKYRLVRKLGEGGMGSVWEAQHLSLGIPVALKLVGEEYLHDESTLMRFRREASTTAAVRCANVVQVFDHDVHDGIPFIVMERLEGETLADRLERVGRLSPADTLIIFRQLERALTCAHTQGIVHRDLKPSNIFLAREANSVEVVKLLDFGVAKRLQPSSHSGPSTRSGVMIGTPCYMSPEQARGEVPVDQRSDLWALGIIAFECLTGKRPFDHDCLSQLVRQICFDPLPVPSLQANLPRQFDDWFARAAARDLARRFSSAAELTHALEQALAFHVSSQTLPISSSAVSMSSADSMPDSGSDEQEPISVAYVKGRPVPVLLAVAGLLLALAAWISPRARWVDSAAALPAVAVRSQVMVTTPEPLPGAAQGDATGIGPAAPFAQEVNAPMEPQAGSPTVFPIASTSASPAPQLEASASSPAAPVNGAPRMPARKQKPKALSAAQLLERVRDGAHTDAVTALETRSMEVDLGI